MDLKTGCAQLGLELTPLKQRLLEEYIALLLQWNNHTNLISANTIKNVIPLHILDSLSVSPYLHGERLIDVGSGAGLPGIPLAIFHPEKTVILLESRAKRAHFLTHCRLRLGLDNVTVVKQRALEYHDAEGFDTILTRAFADLPEIVHHTQHLLANDGVILAMKGLPTIEEQQKLPSTHIVQEMIPLTVPGLDAARHLLVVCRKEK